LYYVLQDSLVEQSSQRSFVIQGRQDILIAGLGTEEHPDCVRTARYGVAVRQYFDSAPCFSSSQSSNIMDQKSQLKDELTS